MIYVLNLIHFRYKATYITLAKEKIRGAISELDAITLVKKPEGINKKEVDLARRFLLDTLRLLEEREKALARAINGESTLNNSGRWSWVKRKIGL